MIYELFWMLVVSLFITVLIVWYLSFNVPDTDQSSISYIAEHMMGWTIAYIFFLFLILALSLAILTYEEILPFAIPFSHPGIFLFFVAVLLLGSFFVNTKSKRYADSHPLMLFTAVYFLLMTLISGVNDSIAISVKGKDAYMLK